MTVGSEKDLISLLKIGKIVAEAREEMLKHCRPGMTTKELDMVGGKVLERYGAASAPQKEYGFPGITCISVNSVVAHGIPDDTVLKEGDLVNIDVSAELDGYYADTGATTIVGTPDSRQKERLCRCAEKALYRCISKARAGGRMNQIGKAVQDEAKLWGFTVIKNLTGHGIGKKLHEAPDHIFNYYDPSDRRILKKGWVLAVETFISTGAEFVEQGTDGWSIVTPDQSYVAQFEHTIVVTDDKPVILTVL